MITLSRSCKVDKKVQLPTILVSEKKIRGK